MDQQLHAGIGFDSNGMFGREQACHLAAYRRMDLIAGRFYGNPLSHGPAGKCHVLYLGQLDHLAFCHSA